MSATTIVIANILMGSLIFMGILYGLEKLINWLAGGEHK